MVRNLFRYLVHIFVELYVFLLLKLKHPFYDFIVLTAFPRSAFTLIKFSLLILKNMVGDIVRIYQSFKKPDDGLSLSTRSHMLEKENQFL